MLEITKYEKTVFSSARDWFQKIKKKDYESAIKVTKEIINSCRNIILSDGSDEDQKNIALIVGIFFRGLEELTVLLKITNSSDWIKKPKTVEKSWILLQNCKDRFKVTINNIQIDPNIVSWINKSLERIDKMFLRYFGPGLYCSPEILVRKPICSICNSDFRKCSHIEGKIYNGVICRVIAQDIQIKAIAIVESPKDPRCRIWPWRTKKGKDGLEVEGIALTMFRIDDFLD